jgi:hypothetical protein
MNSLVLFMIAVIVPLFFASPRTAPMWLSIQALALAWSSAAHHGLHSVHAVVAVIELLLIRGLVAPWLLSGASTRDDESIGHLIPSNLFAWILGISVAILAFEFAGRAAPGDALLLGGVCATMVLALLLLSLNSAAQAQLFALLLMENAAALFESGLPELWSPWVHSVLTLIYVLTVWVGVRLVRQLRDESLGEMPRQVL